jgi:hypothetical protein
VAQVLAHAQDELRQKGYDAQAVELAQSAAGVLEEAGPSLNHFQASRPAQAAEARGSLPGRCEGCGAPLVPGDVIWHDTRTAECPYCGAVIKAT